MAITALSEKQRQILRNARERLGLTQAELAERLGVVSQYVNMIENGKKDASLDVLQRLGVELGLTIAVRTIVTITPTMPKARKTRK